MLNLLDEINKIKNLDKDSLLFKNKNIFYRVVRKYLKKLNVNLLIPYLENIESEDRQYLIILKNVVSEEQPNLKNVVSEEQPNLKNVVSEEQPNLKTDILRKYQKDEYSYIDDDSIKCVYVYLQGSGEKKTISSLFIAKNFSCWGIYISANRLENGNYKVNVEEKKRIILKEDNYDDIVTDMDNYFQNYVSITKFINQKKDLYSKYDMNITYSSIYYLLKYWRSSSISSFAQIPKDVMKIICRKASILP